MSKVLRLLTDKENRKEGRANLSLIPYPLSLDRKRAAFTIVEMLVVIAIIAILAGAITMGVNGMFYKSRFSRAIAMRNALQSGLETYYARMGKWPGPLDSISKDGSKKNEIELEDKADLCFREIVRESVKANANPVLDPTGLFVTEKLDHADDGCTDVHGNWNDFLNHVFGKNSNTKYKKCNGKCKRGYNFQEVTNKGAKHKIKVPQMNFGYAGPNHGRFCKFRLFYYPKSDTVRVYLQPAAEHRCIKHENGYTDD